MATPTNNTRFRERCVVKVLATILWFLLFIVLLPLTAPLLFFFLIYSKIIKLWVQWQHNWNISEVKRYDNFMVYESKEAMYVSTGVAILEGTPDIVNIRNQITHKILEQRNDDGELQFAKFIQYFKEMSGYFFWHWEKDFNIKDHVRIMDGTNDKYCSEKELQELVGKIANKPFPSEKSPWEVLLIPSLTRINEEKRNGESSATSTFGIVCKIHHSIADGISLIIIILRYLTEEQFQEDIPFKPAKKSFLQAICSVLSALFLGPKKFADWILYPDFNLLHGPVLSGEKHAIVSNPISLELVRHIKNKMKTTVNDVFMSTLAGSLHKFFTSSDALISNPVTAIVTVALPSSNYSAVLENHIVAGFIPIAVDSTEPVDRLMKSKLLCDAMKKSPDMLISHFIMNCLAVILPSRLFWLLISSSPNTVTTTNIPGPLNPVKIMGYQLTDLMVWAANRGNTGLTVSFMTYSSQVRVGILIDKAIMQDNKDASDIMKYMVEELHLLKAAVDS